jgi:DNA topoisomerase-1
MPILDKNNAAKVAEYTEYMETSPWANATQDLAWSKVKAEWADEQVYVERDGKKLIPTALGATINDLLEAQFSNIVNVKFSADMETSLDEIEEGKKEWTAVLSDFYTDFSKDLEKAQSDMEGKKVKVPDVVTEEICEVCGKPMVIKTGKFGKFLACSGFPDCKNTKRIVKYAKGSCVKCGGKMLILTSKRGRTFYACEDNANCKFITWEEPTDKTCEVCGKSLYKKAGKAAKPHCVNESCSAYKPTVTRKSSKKGKTTDEG